MMVVMSITSLLFVMATTLMTVALYQSQMTGLRTGRVRATHVADAGINAYLYQLKNASGYYTTNPSTGWVTIGTGEKYSLIASAPANGQPLTLYSTGVSTDGTVTIAAAVRFPTFADYMFLSNSDLNFAANALVNGQVRSNANITNNGHITGKVMAGGLVTGSGQLDQGSANHQPTVDFNQVLVDMDNIMLSAKGNNVYFPASGVYGYRVTLDHSTAVIEKITGGTTSGNLTTTYVAAMTVPDSGALYFSDSVWVQGNYSKPVSVVSDRDIYIPANLTPTDPASTVTCGLIAHGNIIVPCWYASVPQDMVLTAAMLSQSGRVYADMKQGVFRNTITITGSLTYYDANGGFVSMSGSTPVAGFRSRTYSYDQRLDKFPPPKYPVIHDGSLKVDTWVEDRPIG
jgi:hypothetical protein